MTQTAPRKESVGAGDQSWLGSRFGTDTAKSVTLDPSAWSDKISDGRIKSGEPFKLDDGLAVPYDSDSDLDGFILTDQSVSADGGNVTAPGLWSGRILTSKLPSEVAPGASTTGLFVLEA